MKLQISVTEEDIRNGNDTACGCPVALATNRALAEAGFKGDRWFETWHAEFEPYNFFREATGLTIWHYHDGSDDPVTNVPIGDVPYEAREFASMFDDWFRGEEPEDGEEEEYSRPVPFSFDLEIPLEMPA